MQHLLRRRGNLWGRLFGDWPTTKEGRPKQCSLRSIDYCKTRHCRILSHDLLFLKRLPITFGSSVLSKGYGRRFVVTQMMLRVMAKREATVSASLVNRTNRNRSACLSTILQDDALYIRPELVCLH